MGEGLHRAAHHNTLDFLMKSVNIMDQTPLPGSLVEAVFVLSAENLKNLVPPSDILALFDDETNV